MNINTPNNKVFHGKKSNWSMWTAHRQELISAMRTNIVSKFPHKSIALFGAGECNDLDLQTICDIFETVYLLDINDDDIRAGVIAQGLDHLIGDQIIIVKGFDFTGVSPEFYSSLEQMLKLGLKPASIVKLMKNTTYSLQVPKLPIEIQGKIDVVASFSVHSQLFIKISSLLDEYSSKYASSELMQIIMSADNLYTKGVIVFNQLLFNTTRPGGVTYFGLDLVEFSSQLGNRPTMNQIKQYISSGTILKNLMQYKDYFVKGSFQCFQLYSAYNNQYEMLPGMNFWTWPFNESKDYVYATYGIIKPKL